VTAERALALFAPDGHVSDVRVVTGDSDNGVLGDETLVAVLARARRARAALERSGFTPAMRLAHLPDVARSRYVFPMRDPAAAFAFRRIPMSPRKRHLGRLAAGAGMLPSTTIVYRRPGARPLLEWLAGLGQERPRCSAFVLQGWRDAAAAVVFRFAGVPRPDLVVKVGVEAPAEASALSAFGTGAREAGADVPRVVSEGRLGDVPMVAQTFVSGTPAFEAVRGSPARADELLGSVAGWLRGWNKATVTRRPFTEDDAQRLIRTARDLDDSFEPHTRRLATACIGSTVPFVAAHNDLTTVNVLADGERTLGIVDWSSARGACLPLGDLAYAAADVEAAIDGYRDRVASFEGGLLAATRSRLLEDAARELGLDQPIAELGVHACWLQHAANEREPGSFREILRRSLPR
jgi:aminoglycoside phosphotransferase